MPKWGSPGQADQRWKLVHFIRHLPALTPAELARMEQLSPRSAAE